VKAKAKIVVFWALMSLCVVFLWQTTRQDPRGWLRTAAFVVPFVLLTQWFASRFSGRRRRTAWIAVYWALGAMVTGSYAFWEFTRFRFGYQERQSLVGAVIGGAVFVVCSSLSVWSLFRLRKSAATS